MTIKNLQVVSPSTLSLDVTVSRPVCVFHGPYAELALDLLRELIGDFTSISDPDRLDDGRFVLQSDVEVDGKSFNVCYIRNADFMGDHRIAANFVPNRTEFSKDDTVEYVEKCRSRNKITETLPTAVCLKPPRTTIVPCSSTAWIPTTQHRFSTALPASEDKPSWRSRPRSLGAIPPPCRPYLRGKSL